MGQYYKPTCLEENKRTPKAWMYSHQYGNGLKLMEHSWMKNNFVNTVESLLKKGGPWYKQPIVWAGDYADKDKGLTTNVYRRCTDTTKIQPEEKIIGMRSPFIVNHTLKQFVDKRKVPKVDGWAIHPLPLLTCEGNGDGGGDYFGADANNLIGTWARNIISVETKAPADYVEIFFDLTEGN